MVPRRSESNPERNEQRAEAEGARGVEEKATHPLAAHPPTLERGVAVRPVIGGDGGEPGRRAGHLGLLDGLHRRGARRRLPPPLPRAAAAPAPRAAPAARPAGGVARPRRVGLPHARAGPRHARPHSPTSATRWARDRRPGRGWVGGGGVPARRRAVAAREEDLSERRGGAAWRGVARRNANFVVVEVGGEGTRWTVDEVVAWAGCAAARCGAAPPPPWLRLVTSRSGSRSSPFPHEWGGVRRLRPAGVGGEARRGVVATRIRMDAVRGRRLVVSLLPVVAFLVGWGPRFRPCRWGLGTARGNL